MSRLSVAAILMLWGCASYAEDNEVKKDTCDTRPGGDARLCSYEPNTLGYTKDSDDVGFMDFKLSVRYQLFPHWTTTGLNSLKAGLGENTGLYSAATVRFGQYIVTRDSSPVIGKRFNPKLFVRHWTDEGHTEYVDFAFLAHESNGQSIDTPEELQQERRTAQRPEFANDRISRGWDYLEVIWKRIPWKRTPYGDDKGGTFSTYVTLKYFLPRGPLQGRAEEYNDWERDPEGKTRNRVNGVAGLLKYVGNGNWWIFEDFKIAAGYETGYREIFRYNTLRLEFGTKLLQLPINLWTQTGYGSDLAQYYKKVSSLGIEVQLGSF